MKHLHTKRNSSEAFLTLTGTSLSGQNLEETTEGLEVEQSASGRLVQDEGKCEGAVALHVYQAYWRAMGSGLAVAILVSLLLMQGETIPEGPCLPPSTASPAMLSRRSGLHSPGNHKCRTLPCTDNS